MNTPLTLMHRSVRVCGQLLPVLGFAALLFVLLSLSRLGHTATYGSRVAAVDGWLWLFAVGIRMDSVLISMLVSLPILILLVTPSHLHAHLRRPFAVYCAVVFSTLLFMELATVQFLTEFEHRPDRIFWEYIYPPRQEMIFTVLKTAWLSLIAVAILMPLLIWGAWRWCSWCWDRTQPWPWLRSIALLPLIGGVIFLGIRGTLSHRPVNISSAAFSNESLLNQLALNSTYSAGYALYALGNEQDSGAVYGRMNTERMLTLTRAASGIDPASFTSSDIPTLHHVTSSQPRERPLNVVVLLQESLGGQFVGCLGGMPLTPNIDALSKEGLLLTKHYATGTRTVRGIEAVLAGFMPSPSRSVVKLGLSRSGFYTAAEQCRQQGYESLFFYGGESHFDDMRTFFVGNGFTQIIDEPLFKDPVFAGEWGVSDEDLVRRAVTDLTALGDKPFFAFMLSTTTHLPFDFPDGRIELYEQPKQTRHNAIKYADYAIGEFFRLAKQQDFYKNTIFLVVADHNIRTVGDSLVPVDAFRIPALIIGPGFAPGTYDRVCSQLDLMPTILARIGFDFDTPMLGHDLLSLPADTSGRAIMQFADYHAYRVGNRVVIHLPKEAPRCFTLDDHDALTPATEPWPELVEEALAHALLPGHLYRQRMYRLPAK